MSSATETRPLHFSSETLNGLVIIGLSVAIGLPCAFVVLRVVRDIRAGVRDRKEKAKREGDVEAQTRNRTGLELSGSEKNGGLCELEQPGLPELSSIGIMEMWEESVANEVDGGMVPVEIEGGGGKEVIKTSGESGRVDREGLDLEDMDLEDVERSSTLVDDQPVPDSPKLEATK